MKAVIASGETYLNSRETDFSVHIIWTSAI